MIVASPEIAIKRISAVLWSSLKVLAWRLGIEARAARALGFRADFIGFLGLILYLPSLGVIHLEKEILSYFTVFVNKKRTPNLVKNPF